LFLRLPARLDAASLVDQRGIRQLPEIAAEPASLAIELESWKCLQQPDEYVLDQVIRSVLLEPDAAQVTPEQWLIELVKLAPALDVRAVAHPGDQRDARAEFGLVGVGSV